jgi:hypothetical protein
MPRRRALPNRYDLEFLLYIIYGGDNGSDRGGIVGSCGHHSKWEPTEYQLRTGLARLEAHGLVEAQGDRYYADPALVEALRAGGPHGDAFEEYDALARLVEERLGA